jgi:hypothetical protein
MKYIVPQDKLDKIVFKYLDLNLRGLEKRKAKYYNGIVFAFPNEKYGILGWENNDYYGYINTLWVDYELLDEISNTFSLGITDSKYIVGRWAADRLQLKVEDIRVILDYEPRNLA